MTFVADTITVEIESLDADGDGIAHHNGERITVPFTIPGESVEVARPAGRESSAHAVLTKVRRPSARRVAARCQHFGPEEPDGRGGCGGCTWQHIDYREQLRLKTSTVDRIVRGVSPDAPRARAMLTATPESAPWGFRDKVHFVFDSTGQRSTVAMGHYARGSRRVIPVRECPVHAEDGNRLAFELRDGFVRAGVTGRSTLKGLAIRVGRWTNELMTTLVVTDVGDKRVRRATREAMGRAPRPSSLHLNIHPRPDAFIFGRETRRIDGTARLREEVAGVSFLISPTAFFQTNMGAAAFLVRLVLDAVPQRARVLDLYAGAGLFALPLAKRGHEVIAVEENRAAVADGEASRQLNRIPEERCRFIARSVEEFISGGGSRRSSGLRIDVDAIVLDPPREGCDSRVLLEVFGRLRPALAVYVSCDPESLGRDLKLIVAQGYRIASVQPIDMFPHTAHIETVVVLTR